MNFKKILMKWQLDLLTILAIFTLGFFAGTPQGIEMSKNLLSQNPLAFYAIFVPMAALTFGWGYSRLKKAIK